MQSPCIKQCSLNADNICTGCYRSLDEIKEWGAATDDRRIEITISAAYSGYLINKLHNFD